MHYNAALSGRRGERVFCQGEGIRERKKTWKRHQRAPYRESCFYSPVSRKQQDQIDYVRAEKKKRPPFSLSNHFEITSSSAASLEKASAVVSEHTAVTNPSGMINQKKKLSGRRRRFPLRFQQEEKVLDWLILMDLAVAAAVVWWRNRQKMRAMNGCCCVFFSLPCVNGFFPCSAQLPPPARTINCGQFKYRVLHWAWCTRAVLMMSLIRCNNCNWMIYMAADGKRFLFPSPSTEWWTDRPNDRPVI